MKETERKDLGMVGPDDQVSKLRRLTGISKRIDPLCLVWEHLPEFFLRRNFRRVFPSQKFPDIKEGSAIRKMGNSLEVVSESVAKKKKKKVASFLKLWGVKKYLSLRVLNTSKFS